MHHLLRSIVLLSALAMLVVSRDAHAQIQSDPTADAPADSANDDAGVRSSVELEVGIFSRGRGTGLRLAVGRPVGDRAVLTASLAGSAALSNEFVTRDVSVTSALGLKVYATPAIVGRVSPTVWLSLVHTYFTWQYEGQPPQAREHGLGGELSGGASYFITEHAGIYGRVGVGVARRVDRVGVGHGVDVNASTEAGFVLRM